MAGDLVGLHSTDPATVFLSAAARMTTPSATAIETALYEDRTLVRILGMRRTVFVLPVERATIVFAACTRALQAGERRKLVQLLEQSGITDDGPHWLTETEEATLAALGARGEATAAELSADVPQLREEIRFGEGKRWEGTQRMVTRVLFLLSTDGRIVRTRPRGSWTSSQYRWAPTESWLSAGWPEIPPEVARSELARRWLGAFGPGTARDLQWWTGWTAAQTRAALADVAPIEVEIDGVPGFVLAGDKDDEVIPNPWATLLPALDPSVMGWSGREWFLGDHRAALFDRSGNAGPTVWWDGRVVGGWAQRKTGEIAVRLLEDIGSDGQTAVDRAAHELQTWLGDVRVTPRFGTPLVKALTA